MTRTGKIPRLPLSIRNALGERLRDGEPGKDLVAWLNDQPEVQSIMVERFEGRPFTEQNLSEWKQGGYLDWLRHQESLEWAAQMQEQVTELTEAAGDTPISEAVNSLLTVALSRLLRDAMAKPQHSADERKELLALARELTRMRRVDQHAALVKLEQDRRAEHLRYQEKRDAEYARELEERRARLASHRPGWDAFCKNSMAQLTGQPQTRLANSSGSLRNPTESNQIQPSLFTPCEARPSTAPVDAVGPPVSAQA